MPINTIGDLIESILDNSNDWEWDIQGDYNGYWTEGLSSVEEYDRVRKELRKLIAEFMFNYTFEFYIQSIKLRKEQERK